MEEIGKESSCSRCRRFRVRLLRQPCAIDVGRRLVGENPLFSFVLLLFLHELCAHCASLIVSREDCISVQFLLIFACMRVCYVNYS